MKEGRQKPPLGVAQSRVLPPDRRPYGPEAGLAFFIIYLLNIV